MDPPVQPAYADVSAAELTLSLIRGHPDISTLDPLMDGTRCINLNGASLTCKTGILGASHYLAIKAQDTGPELELMEIFACGEFKTEHDVLYRGPLGKCGYKIDVQRRNWYECLDYRFQSWVDAWDSQQRERLQSLEDEIASAGNGASLGLRFEFPEPPGAKEPSDQAPVTLVLLKPQDQGFTLRTVHSYSNEHTVVHTLTTVSLTEGKN